MHPPARNRHSALRPAREPGPALPSPEPMAVSLSAAVLGMRGEDAVVAVLPSERSSRATAGVLPGGFFSPREHGSLERGVRALVRAATGLELDFAQQLCTFGDHDHPATPGALCVAYLALVRPSQCRGHAGISWHSWYAYLPWEDWRRGKPSALADDIEPRLWAWARQSPAGEAAKDPPTPLDRGRRVRQCFGGDGSGWDEEKVLERYELMWDAGLLGGEGAGREVGIPSRLTGLCHAMSGDQARLLASAVGTLRRSIKLRPVLFDLMEDVFTLFELQKTVEAILGPHLHKQNFRRLVEAGGLVEPIGKYRFRTGGRPAQLYRFRREAALERLASGMRIKTGRADVLSGQQAPVGDATK
jgi:hypothetical protein